MIKLQLNLDGSNSDNIKTQTFSIVTDVASDTAAVYTSIYGIFHLDGLKVVHVETNTELTLNVDYYLTYYSPHLKATYDIDGFASIVLTNKTLTGNIEVTANHLGGGYGKYNSTYIVDIIELIDGLPTTIYWDNVIDAPSTANPNAHLLPAENIATGYEDYVAVLWGVSKKLTAIANASAYSKVPVGGKLTLIAPNPNLSPDYWLACSGQTINKADYGTLFAVLELEVDTFTLPDEPNTYVKIG